MNGRAAAWRLCLIGEPALVRNGQDVQDGQDGAGPQRLALGPRDAAWLAYVALEGATPGRQLATLVWPGRDETRAQNNLKQRVHKLRQATEAQLVVVEGRVALAPDLQPDAGPPQPDDPALLARPLLGHHAYDDMPDFAAWLRTRREAWQRQLRQALERAAEAHEAAGRLEEALALAIPLVEADALSESAHRRVMRLHYLRGDNGAAVQAYERCAALLREELGVRPATETRELLALAERGRSGPAPRGRRELPPALRRPPLTVGRAAQAAALQQALAAGDVACLVGEAGMGKSRLLADLVVHDGPALLVPARPGDQASPFATTRRVLQALLAQPHADTDARAAPALAWLAGEGGTPGAPAQRLQAATRALLGLAVAQGLRLLAVDDLHFADAASLEWLTEHALAGEPPGLRWVLAQRPGVAPQAGLAAHSAVRCIELPPLGAPEVEALVDSLALDEALPLPLRQQLHAHTGGNPLFVLETLRELLLGAEAAPRSLPAPRGVEPLIRQRLARLSPQALALARVAALSVPDFDIDLAVQVLGLPALSLADAWAELESAQVLRGEGFAHDLVQDAARQLTPEPVARHAHRQIAAHLEARGADAARVGLHWQRAGEPAPASRAYERAAAEADRRGRLREAGALLQLAAEQAAAHGDDLAAARLAGHAVGRIIQSQGPEAAQPLVAWMGTAAVSPPARAMAGTARAMLRLWLGDDAGAEAAAREVLALPVARPLHAGAARMLAMSLRQRGQARDALAVLEPYMPFIDEIDDLDERASCLADHTSLLISVERFDAASVAADRTLAVTGRLANAQAHATALINRCVCSVYMGELAHGGQAAEDADRLLVDDSQSRVLRAMNRAQWSALLGAMGRFREALPLAEAALADLEQGQLLWVAAVARCTLARLFWRLGQPARALPLVAEAPAQATPPAAVARLLLLAELKGGQTDAARAWLAEAEQRSRAARLTGSLVLTELAAAPLRPPEERLQRLAEAQTLAREAGYRWMGAQLVLARLETLVEEGRPDAAAVALPAATDDLRRWQGPTPYHPQTLLRAARVAEACGQLPLARQLLREALEWIHRAEAQVPEAFFDSFRHRNPVNVAVLAAWRRLAG